MKYQRFGPSDRDRTCGLMVPNHPRSQLRHTRIYIRFLFFLRGSGTNCGQTQIPRFFEFSKQPRKSAPLKAFRDFREITAFRARHAPKPGALPTIGQKYCRLARLERVAMLCISSCSSLASIRHRRRQTLSHYTP